MKIWNRMAHIYLITYLLIHEPLRNVIYVTHMYFHVGPMSKKFRKCNFTALLFTLFLGDYPLKYTINNEQTSAIKVRCNGKSIKYKAK